jgi:steroid delta-isomerase-like uncharacterized protein
MHPFLCRNLLLAAILLVAGCRPKAPENDLETNRAVVRNYHQVWSDGRVAALDTLVAPDFVYHFLNGVEYKGIGGAKAFITGHRRSFPDWQEEIVDMISEGDKVVTRYKSTGTQRGEFNGLAPTGKKVTIYETSIYRIVNGKVAEQWGFPDAVSLSAQLQAKK